MLAGGRVRVNGTIARRADTALAAGDVVEIAARGPRAALPPGLALVYEDGDVIVVHKPAGLLTIATERERERTAYAHLMAYAGTRRPPVRVFVVHRLDRLASGLLVFATSPGAKRALQAQFAAHSVERTYLAVVEGRPARPEGTIASRLLDDAPGRVRETRRPGLARAAHGRASHAARGGARDRAAEPDPRAPGRPRASDRRRRGVRRPDGSVRPAGAPRAGAGLRSSPHRRAPALRLPGAARVRAAGGVRGRAFSLCFGGAAPGRSPSGQERRRHLPRRPRPPRRALRARGGPRSPVSRHRTHGRSHAQPRSTARARPLGRKAGTAGRTSRCRIVSRRRRAARAPVRAVPPSPGPARERTGSRAGSETR